MMVVLIVLVSVCFLPGHYSLPSGCSSYFDFQEKLLEINVRMELTMDNEKNKMETDLATCQSDIRKLKTELQHMRSTETKLSEIQAEADQKIFKLKDLAVKKDVVFHVKDISTQPTGNDIIKFQNVVSNTDNVYNIDTGYFTAPVDGTYWFAAQLCTDTNKYLSPTIYIRETAINGVCTCDNDKVDCSTVNAVAVLQKDDTATLKAGPHQATSPVRYNISTQWTTFTGTKVN